MHIIVNGETIDYSFKEQTSSNGNVYNYLRANIIVSTDPITGHTVRKEVTAPNENIFRRKVNALQHARPLTDGSLLPVGIYLEKWLSKQKLRLKPTSFSGYEYMLEHYILKHLNDYAMSEINEDIMFDFYDTIMDDHGIPTAHKNYYMLNSAFNEAVRKFIIYSNPQENIRLPKKQRGPIVPLSKSESQLLMELSKDDLIYGKAVALALCLGLRISETVGLPVSAYNSSTKTLVIRRQINQMRTGGYILQNSTKNSIARTLHLGVESITLIEESLEQLEKFKTAAGSIWNNEYDCLFTNGTGAFLKHNTLRSHLHTMCDKIGREDFKFHHLRHTCATIMLEQTNNIFLVKETLGHNWLDSTGTYTHTSPDTQRKAFDSITNYIIS